MHNNEKLFRLVRSLSRGEKRHFYFFARRHTHDSKVIRLYRILDNMTLYDEATITWKIGSPRQIPNLKTNLYYLLLDSLRVHQSSLNIIKDLHKKMEHAGILFEKGLYDQSSGLLKAVKATARKYHQVDIHFHAISLQKKILPCTHQLSKDIEALDSEANRISDQLVRVEKLSTFSMRLYRHYYRYGEMIHADHVQEVEGIFCDQTEPGNNFYAKLYFFQGHSWYAVLKKDFESYYHRVKQWNALFRGFPHMKEIENRQYIKALYHLQDACYLTGRAAEHGRVVKELCGQGMPGDNGSNEVTVYALIGRLNQLLLEQNFEDPAIERERIDAVIRVRKIGQPAHTLIELCYKMARWCFDGGDYENAIEYSRHIINANKGIRFDLQAAARCIHLAAHHQSGNVTILASLARSAKKFIEGYRKLEENELQLLGLIKHSLSNNRVGRLEKNLPF